MRRFSSTSIVLTAVLIAMSASAQPSPPPPRTSGRAQAPPKIDVVTSAGEDETPPERRASIVLAKAAPKGLRFDPAWRPFETVDYVATGVALAAVFGSLLIPVNEQRWTNISGFDARVRSTVRASTRDGRFAARDASDVLLMLSINQALVDTLVVAWWGHDAGSVAWEMGWMDVEAIAINNALNGLVAGLASRERPYGNGCRSLKNEELADCQGQRRYRSFYSGHTSTTFTIAGLTCMHHAYLPLYGGGAADTLACLNGFAMAAATGTLRIVADQHFASDVLTGAAMGTFVGTMVPWLLHYRTGDPAKGASEGSNRISLVPTPTGAQLMGVF